MTGTGASLDRTSAGDSSPSPGVYRDALGWWCWATRAADGSAHLSRGGYESKAAAALALARHLRVQRR